MRVLLLIPHKLDPDRHDAVRAGKRPQADYDALASAIAATPDGRADILDLHSVHRSKNWLVVLTRWLFGDAAALAMLGHQCAGGYDVVFSHGEIIGVPFAVLSHFRWRPLPFVTNVYYLVGRRNALWYKFLSIHCKIDRLLLLTREQYRVGRDLLGIPESKLVLITQAGFVDTEYFRATPEETIEERQICSTGLEFRDYNTLIQAAAKLPNVMLKIDPASPWSRHVATVGAKALPPNVEICRMEIGESRRLYAQSVAVAVPLYENPIGAGSTTIVEAMLSGRPVIATCGLDGTFAGRQDLVDGENILLVPVADVDAWCEAMHKILSNPPFRLALSKGARRWAVEHANRAIWIKQNLQLLQAVVLERRAAHRFKIRTASLATRMTGRWFGSPRENR